jgi:hypothetical protein
VITLEVLAALEEHNLPDLQTVGRALDERVSLDHLGSFAA